MRQEDFCFFWIVSCCVGVGVCADLDEDRLWEVTSAMGLLDNCVENRSTNKQIITSK
jgi:hypothetical protein